MTSAEIAITIIPIAAIGLSYFYALTARRRVMDARRARRERLRHLPAE